MLCIVLLDAVIGHVPEPVVQIELRIRIRDQPDGFHRGIRIRQVLSRPALVEVRIVEVVFDVNRIDRLFLLELEDRGEPFRKRLLHIVLNAIGIRILCHCHRNHDRRHQHDKENHARDEHSQYLLRSCN